MFKRVKTGPLAYNVEYQLKALSCKTRALSDAERAVIAAEKSIDEKYPRPTPADVLKTLERITSGGGDEEDADDASLDKEAVNELGN